MYIIDGESIHSPIKLYREAILVFRVTKWIYITEKIIGKKVACYVKVSKHDNGLGLCLNNALCLNSRSFNPYLNANLTN